LVRQPDFSIALGRECRIRWTVGAIRAAVASLVTPRWEPTDSPESALRHQGGYAALRRSALRAALWLEAPLARARQPSYGTTVLGGIFLALDCPAPGRCEDDGLE
jgi:hypothetical protein